MYSSSASQMTYFQSGLHSPSFNQQQSSPSLNFSSSTWNEYFMDNLSPQSLTEIEKYQNYKNGSKNFAFQTPFSHSSSPLTANYSLSPRSPAISAAIKYEKDITQRLFFRALLTSLKQINKYCNPKSSSWKNPFLYKTSLCSHWRLHRNCKFGDSCWYAHGMFELRFVPRMKELPTPEYVSQYLAHLGIHPKILDAVIFDAYCAAGCNPKNEWTSSIKDLEDPFTAHYFSEFAAAPPSSNFTPPDSMPLEHHEKSIDHFQPQWSGVSSSSAEEHSSLDSSNDYTLFGETYPSAFRLH